MFKNMNKRDVLKHKLDRINTLDLVFESVVEKAEAQLKSNLLKHRKSLEYWSERYDLIEISEYRDELKLDEAGREYAYAEEDIGTTEDELLSLLEMRVLHLYKSYELLLKKILKTLEMDVSGVRNINNLTDKYKTYGVDLASVECFQASKELRLVNNSIKHSALISDGVKSELPEFSEFNMFEYGSLINFFERVKPALIVHIIHLINSIKTVIDTKNDVLLEEIVSPIQALGAFAASRRNI